jgi:hypothetical protein
MQQAFTTQQKSISPTIALVRHVSQQKHITLDFPNGVNFNAIYVNHFTQRVQREDQIRFKGPVTVHLMASDIQNCYYLAWWSERSKQYLCSCYSFRRSASIACCHTDDINHQQDEIPAEPVVETVVATTQQEQVEEVAPQQRTVAEWREIVRRGREQDRAFIDGYWKQAKLLQAQVHQPQPQTGV